MPEISWIAVLGCGLVTLILGGIWYSPLLFAKTWQDEAGLSDATLREGNIAARFGITFLLGCLAGATFALFIGNSMTTAEAAAAGACAGFAWVAFAFAINYLFEHRSLKLWLVNGGYNGLLFTAYGAIIGTLQ